MFSGGIFVIIAGILRCALIIADPVNGAAQAGSWAVRETFVAAVIGNIPMIYPLFARTVAKVQSSVLSSALGGSSNKHSMGGSHNMAGGDSMKPSKPARRKMNLMSIGLTTLGGGDSAERIVDNVPPVTRGQGSPTLNGISVTKEFVTSTTGTQRSASLDTRDRGGTDGRNTDDLEYGPSDTRRMSFPTAFDGRPGYTVKCETAGATVRSPPR